MGWGGPSRGRGFAWGVGACLGIALLANGCASAPAVAPALPQSTPPLIVVPVEATEHLCPYMRAMLDWWPRLPLAPGESPGLSSRVLRGFGERLLQRGFVLVERPQDTYWTVSAIARHNLSDREMAHGYIRMAATADFDGKAVRYDFGTRGELRDAGVLFELPASELDAQVQELADVFAARLSPHAKRMCSDWARGQPAREAQLERIRRELVSEIERVRRARRAGRQTKRLEVGAGDPAELAP